MVQVKQVRNQEVDEAITRHEGSKCLVKKVRAMTHIGKENLKAQIPTIGLMKLGGWEKIGTRAGMKVKMKIMTMINLC